MNLTKAMAMVRDGAGRLATDYRGILSEEERQVARMLLPDSTPYLHKIRYFYRLVRYAGYSRFVAMRRAIYWASPSKSCSQCAGGTQTLSTLTISAPSRT